MLWLFLENIDIREETKILHIAPERGIYKRIAATVSPENYHVADLFPDQFDFVPTCQNIDLCALDDWPSEAYDMIIHSHVLEHTPCNIAYTLFHLHRMLRPTGKHIFIVPFLAGRYAESFQNISEEERVRMFAQKDHVRRFGRDDVSAHLGAILDIAEFDAEKVFGAERLEAANIPRRNWHGLNGASTFVLDRSDLKFLRVS